MLKVKLINHSSFFFVCIYNMYFCVCVCSYIVARAMRMPMGPATLLSVCRSDWATSALRRVNSMSQLSMGMQLIRGTPRISLDQSAAHGAYSNYSTRGHRHTDRERERESKSVMFSRSKTWKRHGRDQAAEQMEKLIQAEG